MYGVGDVLGALSAFWFTGNYIRNIRVTQIQFSHKYERIAMDKVQTLTEKLGLTIERTALPGQTTAIRVYKGAKQIFIGTQEAVVEFLADYEANRPKPYEGSIYGYKE